jgi:hypothetical protein
VGDGELDAEAGGGEHVHQGVDGEEVDASADEVGDAELGDSEELCGLGLSEASRAMWSLSASLGSRE